MLQTLYLANMAVFCIFVQPDFVRLLMSDGFVRQSKRALTVLKLKIWNVSQESQEQELEKQQQKQK